MLGFILNDPASEITATVLCGYGAYLLAEVVDASGVLSMVRACICIRICILRVRVYLIWCGCIAKAPSIHLPHYLHPTHSLNKTIHPSNHPPNH